MRKKQWWKSKTLWFNLITGVLFSIELLQGSSWLSKDVYIAALAIGNGILRFMTKQGIGE